MELFKIKPCLDNAMKIWHKSKNNYLFCSNLCHTFTFIFQTVFIFNKHTCICDLKMELKYLCGESTASHTVPMPIQSVSLRHNAPVLQSILNNEDGITWNFRFSHKLFDREASDMANLLSLLESIQFSN